MKLIQPMFRPSTRITVRSLICGLAAGVMVLGTGLIAPPVLAQGYFVPGQQQPAARPAQAQRPSQARPAPAAAPQAAQDQEAEAPIQIPMPPIPELPMLPRGASPPAAVMAVIAVPEVMRASLAAQQIDKVIGERRQKLNAEAQAEQQAWRDIQQTLTNDRAKLSPDQIRTREKDLQDRINNGSKALRARDRIIQEATQVAINAVNANLLAVIRQVADSHGVNLVLHRQGTILNAPEFDLTEQVAAELNKLMPTVAITPDGVSPLAASAAAPAAATPAKK